MAICHGFEWIFMIFSLRLKDALPVLNYVTFATATDNIFILALSKTMLGRKINTGHLVSVLVGLFGVICCEFLIYNGSTKKTMGSENLTLDASLTSNQTFAYIYCLMSRLCHCCTCIIHKKALLTHHAGQRFKNFKLSVITLIAETFVVLRPFCLELQKSKGE